MTAAVSFAEKLPPSVYFKHGAYYCVLTDNLKKQKWIRLGKTKVEAAKRYQQIIPQIKSGDYARSRVYLHQDEGSGPIPSKFLREILRHAKKNAASRSLDFSITISDLQEIASMGNGRCALTGIEFEYGVAKEALPSARRKRLWAPSIDRKNVQVGYTRENIRLVCAAVNIARQEFSDEVLLKIASGLSKMISEPAGERAVARKKMVGI